MTRQAGAWFALTAALALHVVDEASNDFLGFYNPMVLRIRDTLGWFPMPTFTFRPWLIGLTLLVGLLFALTPWAARGSRGAKVAGYAFAAIMLLNGIGHIALSIGERRMVAGVWTAPLLLATSLYQLWALQSTGRVESGSARR
ncbi:MAG: HXXEE domain-containing protein [Gemmatimonadota bacterium]